MRSNRDIVADMQKRYESECGGSPIKLKTGTMKAPDIDMKDRTVAGIISTSSPDSDGEVVLPDGLDMAYFPRKVKTVYLSHNYDQPIGTCRRMVMKDGALYASTYITTTGIGDDILTMMDEGVINGFSIGFASMEYGPPTDEEVSKYGDCHTIHRAGKLFEYSITPMPCNPDALVSMVSKGKIHRSTAVACGLDDTAERKFHPVPIMAFDGTVMVPIRSKQ